MGLRYFVPQSLSHSHVLAFAILEESQSVFNSRIVLPDPNPQLIINFGAPFIWEMDNGTQVELPRAFIRVQAKPLKIRATGACHLIGLTIAAWGLRLVVDEQITLVRTPIIPLDGPWHELTHLLEKTLNQYGEIEALSTLEQFVSDVSSRQDTASIRAVIDLLSANNGRSNLNELAAHCYLSPSQLERHAKYFTGQTVKTLARLIRFDATCAGLLNEPASRLTDLAYKYGYVDQAHFVHEFRAFAACTPREARVYVRQLAQDAQFLQFS